MHVPSILTDDLYHKQGNPTVSNKQNEAFVIAEQGKFNKHPNPGVLHPAKNELQATSEVAIVLSVHSMGLQVEFDQIQNFYISVVWAIPHAYLG